MIYSKKNLSLLFALGLLLGCSATVEDKSKQGATEKLVVKSLSGNVGSVIGTDNTASANLIGKRYTIKACLEDIAKRKDLSHKNVTVAGKSNKTDSEGCTVWEEKILIDFNSENKCMTFSKKIAFTESKLERVVNYSIDVITNSFENTDITPGCTSDNGELTALTKEDSIILDDVILRYKGNVSDVRSDDKFINHVTEFNTCLDVKLTDEGLSRTPLKITISNKETTQVNEISVVTDKRGCFNSKFASRYMQYSYSHWMKHDINIEVLNGPLKGSQTGRPFWINPWEPTRTLYGVGKVGEKPMKKESKENKNAKLHLDGLMYIMIGNDTSKFSVNEYLGLTINKMYQVVLSPWVSKGHRYTVGSKKVSRIINEGKFKLSFMILAPKKTADIEINKDNFDQFEYLTGAKKIVDVKNGTINALINLPIKMTDVPRLALRTVSVIKIESVEDIGLEPTIVTGFFKARLPWIKTNVNQSEDLNKKIANLEAKIEKAEHVGYQQLEKECFSNKGKDKSEEQLAAEAEKCITESKQPFAGVIETKEKLAYKKHINTLFSKLEEQSHEKATIVPFNRTAKEIFVDSISRKYTDLVVIDNKQAKEQFNINLTTKDFDSLMPKNGSIEGLTKNMVEELCRYGFTKDGDTTSFLWWKFKKSYDSCLDNPGKYLQVKPLRHVRKVEKITPEYSNGMVLSIGERYNASKGAGTSDYQSYRTGYDAAIKIPFLDFLNIGIRVADVSFTHSKNEFENIVLSESVGNGKNLGIEKFSIKVDASFDRCLLVQGKEYAAVDKEDVYYSEKLGHNVPLYYNPNDVSKLDMSFYICDENEKRESFSEAWYYIESYMSSTTMVRDQNGPTERKLLKVVRGERSYLELRKALQDMTKYSLRMDTIGYMTPDRVLNENWGHLLGNTLGTEEQNARDIRAHVEGSYPGTIE